MGDRFEGYGVPRAFACVIRHREGRRELLVFDHPGAGTQIPKGRIDPGESPRQAARRELAEESGLEMEPKWFIGETAYGFTHPHTGEPVEETGYIWLFEAPADIDDSWTHEPEEEALPFSYRWIPLHAGTADVVHHHFSRVVNLTNTAMQPRT